ncbi:hypothetical protein LINPERHAP1_LOCUS20153 [Linum perenne]
MELFNPPLTRHKPHFFFTSLLPSSTTRRLRVSAHFSRPYRRRNSLREKLIEEQQVRRLISISTRPPPPSSESQNPGLSLDEFKESSALDIEEQGNDSVSLDNVSVNELKPNLGDSVLLSKLEKWVDQYKNDAAYWGVGSGPIFTVFSDVDGNVKRVEVNEDEILVRNELEDDSAQVQLKISYAKELARKVERGLDVIPKNSSLAKFVVLGGGGKGSSFVSSIRGVVAHPRFVPVLSGVGKLVLFSLVAAWALKKLLKAEKKKAEFSQLEKEMMRRKIKKRKEKEELEENEVQVIVESPVKVEIGYDDDDERPKIDKQQLMRNIFESNAGMDSKLLVVDDTSASRLAEVDPRILEIQAMARKAREIEREERSVAENVEEGSQVFDVESFDVQDPDSSKLRGMESSDEQEVEIEDSSISQDDLLENRQGKSFGEMHSSTIEDGECRYEEKDSSEVAESFSESESSLSSESVVPKPRVITSVEEAREFLSKRKSEDVQISQDDSLSMSRDDNGDPFTFNGKRSNVSELNVEASEPFTSGRASNSFSADTSQSSSKENEAFISKEDHSEISMEEVGIVEAEISSDSLNTVDNGSNRSLGSKQRTPKWLEEHSDELEPIFQMIGEGFKDNFKIARETANENSNISLDSLKLEFQDDDGEVDWMKDECLRDIVFRVRDNELCGRDPFHMMEAEDKHKFFEGLQKKVERENEKLLKVHKYIHANIENLDYGADGISLHDPPEKFIPRWKGPPIEKNPDFLQNATERLRDMTLNGKDTMKDNKLGKNTESKLAKSANPSSASNVLRKDINKKDPKLSKIVIEGSDGSAKPGKKSGKEFWQHTKKWSRGFVDSYSAETDPEVKSTMKDIGKDLDKWITEEEVQEAADMMSKLPVKTKEFVEKKINKLKREMELFGPQAVVSKYREYSDEKEEDFLWWLDLPHVLCIELYTTENGEQRTGFYSLEMAADLELQPKPCHVIAFEDLGDCRNLCYIIQAHLEMLGNGHAFVVPRPPKDAFREAKANGFSVTVIRKGQLQMNIDQPLEEVEEEITEIGSKIYHDKLMKERSVDTESLMKGVLGFNVQTAKRKISKKRKPKKPTRK